MELGHLRLPGVIASVGPLVDFLGEVSVKTGLTGKQRHAILLAADELATNVIRHGYEEAGLQGEVEITAETNDDFLTVTLSDTGEPFDPRTHDEPDLSLPIEERNLGGLGIYLTLQQLDDFQYQRLDGKNMNRLRIRLPKPTAP